MTASSFDRKTKKTGMKYVWGYLALTGTTLLIAFAVCQWIPAYRRYLREEDSLVENLSAAFFVFSCFLALLILKKRKDHKKLLILISGLALLGFLDELSFGERIFGLSMPRIGGVKIDAAHDLFDLAHRELGKFPYLVAGIGAISAIAFFKYWSRAVTAMLGTPRHPHHFLILFFGIQILAALLIDTLEYRPLFVLEELLEMNAAIALSFCCLSLPNPVLNPTGIPLRSTIAG